MNKEKLKDWLSRQFYKMDEALGPCCKLVCRHLSADGRTKTGDVFQIMVPHNEQVVKVDEDELLIMANQIESSVLEDAEGIGGVQRYQILAYHTQASRPVTRFTFRMSAADLDEYEDEFSEPASTKGQHAQIMRHNEALMRIAVMGANQALGLQNRTIARQADLIEKMMSQRMEEFELIEELRSNQHERELMTKAEEAKQERYNQLFEKGKVLLPVVANRIAGRKVLPEDTDPMVETLKSLVETLDPGQVSDILPRLRPEQQIALLEFIEAYQNEHGDKKQLTEGDKGGTNGA